VYEAFNFSLKLLSVLSKQLAYKSQTRPRVLNTSMPNVNISQYVKTSWCNNA